MQCALLYNYKHKTLTGSLIHLFQRWAILFVPPFEVWTEALVWNVPWSG